MIRTITIFGTAFPSPSVLYSGNRSSLSPGTPWKSEPPVIRIPNSSAGERIFPDQLRRMMRVVYFDPFQTVQNQGFNEVWPHGTARMRQHRYTASRFDQLNRPLKSIIRYEGHKPPLAGLGNNYRLFLSILTNQAFGLQCPVNLKTTHKNLQGNSAPPPTRRAFNPCRAKSSKIRSARALRALIT